MSKPKTYNVYATFSELVSAGSDEITIRIAGRRGDKEVNIHLRICSYAMSRLAAVGKKGIEELKAQAASNLKFLENRLEAYGRP